MCSTPNCLYRLAPKHTRAFSLKSNFGYSVAKENPPPPHHQSCNRFTCRTVLYVSLIGICNQFPTRDILHTHMYAYHTHMHSTRPSSICLFVYGFVCVCVCLWSVFWVQDCISYKWISGSSHIDGSIDIFDTQSPASLLFDRVLSRQHRFTPNEMFPIFWNIICPPFFHPFRVHGAGILRIYIALDVQLAKWPSALFNRLII